MEHLLAVAHDRLKEVAGERERAFRNKDVQLEARVQPDEPDKQDWWAWQIIEAAKKQAYYAELNRSHRWISLSLRILEFQVGATQFVISLHAVSRAADLYATAAFLTWPLGGSGGRAFSGLVRSGD